MDRGAGRKLGAVSIVERSLHSAMSHPSADSPHPGPHHPRPRPTLREYFFASLALGLIGFGGGVSVLEVIRNRMVTRRGWVTDREFTNAATVSQMLPGGASTNTLAYLGLRFHNLRGALAGYVGFILPGAVAICTLAWVYVRFGSIPHAGAFLAGLNAGVVGVIGAITFKMLRTSISRLWQMAVAAGALLLSMVGDASSLEIALIGIVAGLALDFGFEGARLWRFKRFRRRGPEAKVALPEEGQSLPVHEELGRSGRKAAVEGDDTDAPPPAPPRDSTGRVLIPILLLPAVAFGLSRGEELARLLTVFFRTGLGAYGGGFAIIPSLHAVVHDQHWLTEQQFADAVAVGKLTPGPVLLMATFIGYLLSGVSGAVAATLGIFAAPFLLVTVLGTWLDRMRSRRWVRAALRGLTPAVVGLMAAAALTLGQTLRTGAGLGIAAATALTLVRFDLNPVPLLAVAGSVRVILHMYAGY